jgi:CSLREA domain-containing protein
MRPLSRHWLIFLLFLLIAAAVSLKVVLTPAYAAGLTYTVNSLDDTDDGACNTTKCTLRDAINAANANAGADTINFSVSGTITLTSTLPGLTGDLTIDGTGRNIVIDGAQQHTLITTFNGTLSLISLTLTNGKSDFCGGGGCDGGAIFEFEQNVNITNCIFSNNSASRFGGAIAGDGGKYVITGSTFSGNTAGVAGGAICAGICSVTNFLDVGDVTVTDSVFTNNSAQNYGGAINYDGSLNVSNSTFSGNSGGNGGAISKASDGDVLTVNSTVFSGNSANTGGGVYSIGSATITNDTFSGNNASVGGGMFVEDGFLYLANSSFVNNAGSAGGGGLAVINNLATVTGGTFSGNSAPQGGAIYSLKPFPSAASLQVINSSFSNNQAASNSDVNPVAGGAIFNLSGELTVTNSAFSSNSALASGTQPANGDAISNNLDPSWTVSITNSTFSSNSTSSLKSPAVGAAIYNSGGTVNVTNATLSGNVGVGIPGAGGGIYTENNATLVLKNNIIANNVGECVNAGGTVTGTHNLIMDGATACGLTNGSNGNLIGFDPLLRPLSNNGGPTQTFALGVGSPAIDAGTDVTTLNGEIDKVVTSIPVADAIAFPAGVGFAIQIDSEQMIVTGKTGNTLTVTRGANGSSVDNHSNGAAVNPAFDQRSTGFIRKSGTQVDMGAFEHYALAITAAVGIARSPGTTANSQIATVSYDGAVGNIVVSVTSSNPSNGVTLSNIVNTNGVITADVAATAGAATTTFTLQASDGIITTTDTLTVTICSNSPPVPTVTGATNGTGTQDQACPEEPLTLTANSSGAASYQWYKDGTAVLGQTTSTLTVTAAGTYTATALANGCPSTQSAGYVVCAGQRRAQVG